MIMPIKHYIILWGPNSQKYEHSNEEKNFGDPPYPPKKAYFGQTKAKMGRFSQKGCDTVFWSERRCADGFVETAVV